MTINTKTYLLLLLILFLLVNSSVGAPPVGNQLPQSIKKFGKQFLQLIWKKFSKFDPKKPEKEVKKDTIRKQINNTINEERSIGVEKIDGLNLVKAYLNKYGYFPDSDEFTDNLDKQAKSSIEDYQKFFKLNVTGYPDNDTLDQISVPRCAVPDVNLTYNLSNSNFSWPLGKEWFPNGRMNLTYGFVQANELPENVTKVFKDSFKRWSDAIRVVNLTETKYDDADIKIGFIPLENITIGDEVVGVSLIGLESGNSPRTDVTTVGLMVLDDSKYLLLPSDNASDLSWEYYIVDLETVVMHQIGHLLGLEHSSDKESVMYPSILPSMQRKVKLSEDDKEQIQKVYSSSAIRGRGVIPFGSFWELVTTTLSLGFGCMVLFYY